MSWWDRNENARRAELELPSISPIENKTSIRPSLLVCCRFLILHTTWVVLTCQLWHSYRPLSPICINSYLTNRSNKGQMLLFSSITFDDVRICYYNDSKSSGFLSASLTFCFSMFSESWSCSKLLRTTPIQPSAYLAMLKNVLGLDPPRTGRWEFWIALGPIFEGGTVYIGP